MSGLIARLIEAGTPADLIEEVAMELARAKAMQEVIELRRAKDRERKRVPRNSTESEESAEFHEQGFPDKEAPQTPKEINPSNPPLKGSPPKAGKIAIPDWVPEQNWAAFVEMRRLKKKPVTPFIAERLFGKLRKIADAGWNIADVLDRSTVNCWQDLFMPEEGRDHGVRRANAPPNTPFNIEEYRQRLARVGKSDG